MLIVQRFENIMNIALCKYYILLLYIPVKFNVLLIGFIVIDIT